MQYCKKIETCKLTAGPRAATDLVHLDSETGEIVVANKIDHEEFPFLNFTVRATDSGVPLRSSLADVFIQVLDENDNNPYFVGDVNNITVREDAPVGECILHALNTCSYIRLMVFVSEA
jgi:hypothetical protein